ncbi:hypothetical protein [Sphingomonas sp.]|uniref:hypothetical protein n=1 Tax=Sphingomonas sp. TaxID=28214 RepID=UPI00345BA6BA
MFGAEAAAAGLSLKEALEWGKNAQIIQDLIKLKFPKGRDSPGDAALITLGYKYYSRGCSK